MDSCSCSAPPSIAIRYSTILVDVVQLNTLVILTDRTKDHKQRLAFQQSVEDLSLTTNTSKVLCSGSERLTEGGEVAWLREQWLREWGLRIGKGNKKH
jgi:hypothetical protein